MRLPVISLCFHSIVPFFARSIVSDCHHWQQQHKSSRQWHCLLAAAIIKNRACVFLLLYIVCVWNLRWSDFRLLYKQTMAIERCDAYTNKMLLLKMGAPDSPRDARIRQSVLLFLFLFSTICHANSFARIVLYLHRHFNPVRCFIILFRTTCKMISRIPWQHHRRRWRREIKYSCAASIAPVVTVARFEKQPRNVKIKGNADKTRLWVNSVFYISDE